METDGIDLPAGGKANKVGFLLAHPPPGEEIVVSGLAGKFPNSNDTYEFRDQLFNKVDLMSDHEKQPTTVDELPLRFGKMNELDKLDAGYFGMGRQAHCTDPMSRLILEKAVESIIDAGINPSTIVGTNTAVYIGVSWSDTQKDILMDSNVFKGDPLLGCILSQVAQRVSYHLQLNGPSFIGDTACSSSGYALELAYRSIRMGKCDQAIVGGVNLCLFEGLTLQFSRLGMLSHAGIPKVFDEDADGYVRADAACTILLQKARNAKRIYCKIIHAKVNSDGYKSEGITFPSKNSQRQCLNDFYEECDVHPSTISFVEAHGTGTRVGDPEEVSAIASVFCKNRSEPLLIGSVKSNMGHSEPASGLCSLAKIIFTMETGFIPPNINFKTPKRDIAALHDGRIKVVTKKTPWKSDQKLIALNNFGFGGANAHILLAPNDILKVDDGQPNDNLPRLICASGRIKEAVSSLFDVIKNKKLDVEYVRLLHEVFCNDVPNEIFRGFSIVSKNGELTRSIKARSKTERVCLIFNGFDDDRWLKVREDLVRLPVFEDAMKRIQNSLESLKKQGTFEYQHDTNGNNLKNLFGMVATQIGLLEIIRKIGVEPDYFMGSGVGELICAYCDGLLSLEQVLIATYHIGTSKFSFGKYTKDETDFTSMMKIGKDLSAIIGFQQFKATKWIRNHTKSSKLSLLDVLLNSIKTQDAPQAFSNKTLLIHFDNKTLVFDNSLCLIDFDVNDSILSLLTNIGRLYENGVNLNLANLYPEVKWPVSRGTSMLSPYIKWQHDSKWFVANSKQNNIFVNGVYAVNMKYNEWEYVKGHVIDGSVLFPAIGYLYLVWSFVSDQAFLSMEYFNVVFENVKFLRASNLTRQDQVFYKVSVKSDGQFEVADKDDVLVTGYVYQLEKTQENFTNIDDLDIKDNEKRIPLLAKDIYKELKLRGYNYIDAFRGIVSCNNQVTKGTLKWDGNWVTLIDSMLQINLLHTDSRNLYVPTGIAKLFISPKKHEAFITNERTVDVYCRKEANITTCGAVELIGLSVSPISKRKTLAEAVLESYEFVPNEGSLSLEQCIRVNTQIILEDVQQVTFKMVEVLYSKDKGKEHLCTIIQRVLSDQPLIQPEIKLLSNESPALPGVVIENTPLSNISNCLLIVGIDLLTDTDMLTQAVNAVRENGFIITRQNKTFQFNKKPTNLELITLYETEHEVIILLKKYRYQEPKILNITDPLQDLSWVPKLQQLRETNGEIVIVSQNIDYNGILGFVNCLRREPEGNKIRCAVLKDGSIRYDLKKEFYKRQMRKGMAINVYQDGKWGTYRHLLLKLRDETIAETAFVNSITPGDLSSLKWIQGPLTINGTTGKTETLVQVYYSALNFRDILMASGKMPNEKSKNSRIQTEGIQGMEFAGRDLSGKRVFGLTLDGALSTLLVADPVHLWEIPDEWTMAEAVTIPIVYATVLYAFVRVAGIRRNQTVLIHSGSGGVGQAAIHVALHYGCKIFTTVGSDEKKAFLLKHFPQIRADHIGNSRDITFEQMILNGTHGHGVDIVLNSLIEDKLHATVRCIAKGGYYLEIGKADIFSNNELSMKLYEKGIKATGVMLDKAWPFDEEKRIISELMTTHIRSGAIKPLHNVIYKSANIEAAYRFMGAGKHIGKVVIEIRPEEHNKSFSLQTKQLFKCKPVFYCKPESTYIIIGGLGGVGLELADWLIVKGCKKLILVSRHGLKTGYQALRIRYWEKYVSVIQVSTEDVSTRESCIRLLKAANEIGPVDGIFNLAVDLKDALFENQNIETFMASLKPKALATRYLDETSRQHCPQLRYFVVFSSVSAGRGNQGQTNYGLSNSIMENICETRRSDGFPALAVQWGAIGDVGLVADMNELNKDIVIGGTLPQRIFNCLEVLDGFLFQDKVIVSSMVVAEKTVGGNTEEIVCNILGIKNIETVNQSSTFSDLGMDSITAVEIKQVIESQFDITLTPTELKNMTFLRLQELSQNTDIENTSVIEKDDWLNYLLRYMNQVDLTDTPSLQLNGYEENNEKFPEVSFLPGIEGMCTAFQPLISKLNCCANVCQFLFTYPNDSVQSIAKEVVKFVKRNNSTFTLVAYSFGCLVALEVIALLEAEGCVGRAIFIDGSLQQVKTIVKMAFPMQDEEDAKNHLLQKILQSTSFKITEKFKAELASRVSIDEKINYVLANVPNETFSSQYLRDSFYMIWNRIKAVHDYECSFKKLKSRVKLLKPVSSLCPVDDTAFSDLFETPVEVKVFDGDHESILKSDDVAKEINDFIIHTQ